MKGSCKRRDFLKSVGIVLHVCRTVSFALILLIESDTF